MSLWPMALENYMGHFIKSLGQLGKFKLALEKKMSFLFLECPTNFPSSIITIT